MSRTVRRKFVDVCGSTERHTYDYRSVLKRSVGEGSSDPSDPEQAARRAERLAFIETHYDSRGVVRERVRRGSVVRVPSAWVGAVTSHQTRRRRREQARYKVLCRRRDKRREAELLAPMEIES